MFFLAVKLPLKAWCTGNGRGVLSGCCFWIDPSVGLHILRIPFAQAAILCFYGYWHSHTPLLPQQLGLFPTVQLLPSRRQLHFPVQQCGLDVGQTLWLDPRKATTPKCTIKLYEAQPSLFAFWIRAHGINWLTSHPSSAHCKFKAFSQTLSSGFRDLAQIVQACACWCLWR